MSHVGIGHDESVAAHLCEPAALDRPAVDGHAFAEYIVIAKLNPGILAAKSEVLGLAANGAERKETVVSADLGRTMDDHM